MKATQLRKKKKKKGIKRPRKQIQNTENSYYQKFLKYLKYLFKVLNTREGILLLQFVVFIREHFFKVFCIKNT